MSDVHWVISFPNLPYMQCTHMYFICARLYATIIYEGLKYEEKGEERACSAAKGTKIPFTKLSVMDIFASQKYLLDPLNYVHIWQVSPQLSCGVTCQI